VPQKQDRKPIKIEGLTQVTSIDIGGANSPLGDKFLIA
jgi:hypothetical protein